VANTSINRLLYTPAGLTMVGWGDVAHLSLAALDEIDEGAGTGS
jgi:probable phosphoglycerate mutase